MYYEEGFRRQFTLFVSFKPYQDSEGNITRLMMFFYSVKNNEILWDRGQISFFLRQIRY